MHTDIHHHEISEYVGETNGPCKATVKKTHENVCVTKTPSAKSAGTGQAGKDNLQFIPQRTDILNM